MNLARWGKLEITEEMLLYHTGDFWVILTQGIFRKAFVLLVLELGELRGVPTSRSGQTRIESESSLGWR